MTRKQAGDIASLIEKMIYAHYHILYENASKKLHPYTTNDFHYAKNRLVEFLMKIK
jgi:hypothetical protein